LGNGNNTGTFPENIWPLAKVTTFSPKITVNKLEFRCNKKFSNEALNPISALNLERLLSAHLRHTSLFYVIRDDILVHNFGMIILYFRMIIYYDNLFFSVEKVNILLIGPKRVFFAVWQLKKKICNRFSSQNIILDDMKKTTVYNKFYPFHNQFLIQSNFQILTEKKSNFMISGWYFSKLTIVHSGRTEKGK
jgi:hypothetical protein